MVQAPFSSDGRQEVAVGRWKQNERQHYTRKGWWGTSFYVLVWGLQKYFPSHLLSSSGWANKQIEQGSTGDVADVHTQVS